MKICWYAIMGYLELSGIVDIAMRFKFANKTQEDTPNRCSNFPIMRSVIPVVFYEITNVQCVCWSDTATFIGRI